MIKNIFVTILLFTLTAYAATRALQGDTWKSNDLSKTWTPPSATDTLMGLSASQTVTGIKQYDAGILRVTGTSSGYTSFLSSASATARQVTLPDLTGTIALTAGAQTLSDKTLLSPTISGLGASSLLNAGTVSGATIVAIDNIFTIQDDATPTKKAQFQASGITANNTRTITLPDFNFTPAAIDQAQTWTAIPNLNAGVTVSGTFTGNNNLIFANSKGLDFSATSNAVSGTTTSENFTDYEEGTCDTLGIFGTSSAGAGTYTTQTCIYTKTGRKISVAINLLWTAHTGTGNLRIRGLPFVSNATFSGACAVGILENLTISAGNIAVFYVIPNSNEVDVRQYTITGGSLSAVAMDTSAQITISCTYMN